MEYSSIDVSKLNEVVGLVVTSRALSYVSARKRDSNAGEFVKRS